MHKRDKKMTKKVLYKHMNSWIPAYDMQGFGLGQAAEDRNWFDGDYGLRYCVVGM